MRKITATHIFNPGFSDLNEQVLVFDDAGYLQSIEPLNEHDAASVEHLEGVLVPGFVNTHCHLELSHMKNVIPTGTGLIDFVKGVVSMRAVDKEEILHAIDTADTEMYNNGIVAVGDISNQTDTFKTKANSKLYYHTFVEFFDLNAPALTQGEFEKYRSVLNAHPTGENLSCMAVPHAPYSVSEKLFSLINELNRGKQGTISIHNQETLAEQAYFIDGESDFIELFKSFGAVLNPIEATGKTAIHYALTNMDAEHKTLFVHNTLTNEKDIEAAQVWNTKSYFATCPNANLYIENKLPNYRAFLNQRARMTIGTDSLTSNWQLSVFEEIKTIKKYQSYIPLHTLLEWATINGAEALGLRHLFGSFELGLRPGAVLLKGVHWEADKIDPAAKCQRIV